MSKKRATPLDEKEPVALRFGLLDPAEEEGLACEFEKARAKWAELHRSRGMEPPRESDEDRQAAVASLEERAARATAFFEEDEEEAAHDVLAQYMADHAQYTFLATWYEVHEEELSERERALWRRCRAGHDMFRQAWLDLARRVQLRVQQLSAECENLPLASFLAHVGVCRFVVVVENAGGEEESALNLWTGLKASARAWRVLLVEPNAAAYMSAKQARLVQHLHVLYHYRAYVRAALERALLLLALDLNALSPDKAWALLERHALLGRLADALRVAQKTWLA